MPAPLGVWGTSSKSSDWLSARFDGVGLDGSICSEYVLSLVELYKGPSDQAAAISEFLSDSVSSSHVKESDRIAWVNETVGLIQRRLGGGLSAKVVQSKSSVKTTVQPPVVQPVQPVSAGPKKGGFKKGIKLTGTALKEVVGHVRPSYVQRYSDDEDNSAVISANPVSRQISSRTDNLLRFDSGAELFPSLEQPTGKKIRNRGARELAPGEDWGDDEKLIFATPMESRDNSQFMMTPMQSPVAVKVEKKKSPRPVVSVNVEPSLPPTRKKVLSMSTVAATAISPPPVPAKTTPAFSPPAVPAKTPSPPPMSPPLPTDSGMVSTQASLESPDRSDGPVVVNHSFLNSLDLLNFDFKFEGDEDDDEQQQTNEMPIDLLKQMFTTSATSTQVQVAPDEPPLGLQSVRSESSLKHRKYSVSCLLEVQAEMRRRNMLDDTPPALKSLTYQVEAPARKSEGPSWRTVDDKGGWKNKWANSRSSSNSRKTSPHPEGFW